VYQVGTNKGMIQVVVEEWTDASKGIEVSCAIADEDLIILL